MVSIGMIGSLYQPEELDKSTLNAFKINQHFCGGVLIHDEWVLTAAHCVHLANTSTIGVGIGTNDLVEMYDLGRIPVSQINFHSDYNPFSFHHDLALIQLSIPVSKSVFATKTYTTACLGVVNTNNRKIPGLLYSIGWENISPSTKYHLTPKTYHRYLQYIKTEDVTYSDTSCKERDDLVCTFPQQQGSGTCWGNDDGPLVNTDPVVLGILSNGNADKDDWRCNGDSKYIRVAPALHWINETIEQTVCIRDLTF